MKTVVKSFDSRFFSSLQSSKHSFVHSSYPLMHTAVFSHEESEAAFLSLLPSHPYILFPSRFPWLSVLFACFSAIVYFSSSFFSQGALWSYGVLAVLVGLALLLERKRIFSLFHAPFFSREFLFGLSMLLSYIAGLASYFVVEFFVFFVISISLCAVYLVSAYAEYRLLPLPSLHHARFPSHVRIVVDRQERDIPLSEVVIGDTLKIRPGDVVPFDGTVLVGSSRVQQRYTGLHTPVKKRVGDTVYAGSVNQNGMFLYTVSSLHDSSLYSAVDARCLHASKTLHPYQSLFSSYSVAFSYLFGFLLVTLALFSFFFFENWFPVFFALSIYLLLLFSYVLLPLLSGYLVPHFIRLCWEKGVFVPHASTLHSFSTVSHVLFSRTGVVTHGNPSLAFIRVYDVSETIVLRYAAGLASVSEHPLSRAILQEAHKRSVSFGSPRKHSVFEHKGVLGVVEGRKVAMGTIDFFKEQDIGLFDAREQVPLLAKKYSSVVLIAVENQLAAIFAFLDPVREEFPSLCSSLSQQGFSLGISSHSPEIFLASLLDTKDFSFVRAGISSSEQVSALRALRAKKDVLFVGSQTTPQSVLSSSSTSLRFVHDIPTELPSSATLLYRSLNPLSWLLSSSQAVSRMIYRNGVILFVSFFVLFSLGVLVAYVSLFYLLPIAVVYGELLRFSLIRSSFSLTS